MYPILLKIGHFELHSYGVIVAVSFLAALWVAGREAKRKGIDPALVQDFAFYAFLGGLVGARLYFIAFSDPLHYLRNPWEILAVWRGGIGIIGALAAGSVVALWYCRRKGIPFLRLADVIAPALPLGQTLGELACLATGDSYGARTDLPWAIVYTDPRALAPLNVPLHPIEFYEMGAYFLVFLLVWMTRKRFKVEGFAMLTYLAGYGVARFVVEFFRGNPAILAWGVPAAQVFAAALVLVSLLGFWALRRPGDARA